MKVTFSGSYYDVCFLAKVAPGALRSLAKAAGFMLSALTIASVFLCMHNDEPPNVASGRSPAAERGREGNSDNSYYMNFKHLVQVRRRALVWSSRGM